jgi:hypothetical protein
MEARLPQASFWLILFIKILQFFLLYVEKFFYAMQKSKHAKVEKSYKLENVNMDNYWFYS